MARVLLVEDEPSIAGIIRSKLGREGHDVWWEADPAAGEVAAAGFLPDLALIDADAEGDPLALVAALHRTMPVLVLTGLHDEATPGIARRAGARATVRKPFKPTVLARTVAQLVG